MNKKAQTGPVSFIFNIIFFFIVMGLIGGTLWGLIGFAGASVGLTGLEAFIFDNFAMVVFGSAILGTMAFFYISGA